MKKGLVILVFLGLLILPMLSAIQVDMNKNFKNGETLVAKFSGEFTKPILEDNVYFFRGNVKVPFDFSLIKINQDYFLYAPTLGRTPGNYSMIIEGSEYSVEGGQTSTSNIVENFTLLSDYADFSTLPGVVQANKSFTLEVENLKGVDLTIYIDKYPSEEQTSQQGFFSFFSNEKNNSPTGEPLLLKAGMKKEVKLYLDNVSANTLHKIKLESQNFSQDIFVYINNPNYELNETEYVEINETNQTEINQTDINNTENATTQVGKTCEELNGTICKVGKEVCNGTIIDASNTDSCCDKTCKEKEKSSRGKIIGFSIIGFLVLIYLWFYFKKFKKPKKKVDLLELAEGKDKRKLDRIRKRVVPKKR